MRNISNKDFRNKNIRGAKVDDLFIYLEMMKEKDEKKIEYIEEVQRFIEFHFKYNPVKEQDDGE